MPDYSQGKIYTIRCRNDDALIYVGSTTQPLSHRWGGHKLMSLRKPNILVYQTINNEWDNWYIELYELYPCNSKMELEKREGEITREISTLNMRIEGRKRREYLNDNAEKIREQRKNYRMTNADELKNIYKTKYYDNLEKERAKSKKYYNQNKDNILEKQQSTEYKVKRKEYMKLYYQRKKAEKQQLLQQQAQ